MRTPDSILDYFNYRYESPEAFWLLLLVPAAIAWYVVKMRGGIHFSKLSVLGAGKTGSTVPSVVRDVLFGLEMLALALAVCALARPQNPADEQYIRKQYTEGIDIILAIDISGSMLAEDFEPNRLEAAKAVAESFIERRPNDNIGLVVYEGAAFLQCPLTNDHDFLLKFVRDLQTGTIAPGTAIGTGLGTAAGHLFKSENKSKVVILLTDGVSNTGQPALTVAQSAAEFGIRVYTIGVGTDGLAPTPVKDILGFITQQMLEVEIDEETLQQIAQITGGAYFRAKDNDELEAIYSQIDELEKSRIQTISYKSDPPEEFGFLLALAAGILLLSSVVKRLVFNGLSSIT
jgi:Ca-activated chloride channel family protein